MKHMREFDLYNKMCEQHFHSDVFLSAINAVNMVTALRKKIKEKPKT